MAYRMINESRKIPKLRRHCPVCDAVKTFVYDPIIGHSRCKECGSRVINTEPETWTKRW